MIFTGIATVAFAWLMLWILYGYLSDGNGIEVAIAVFGAAAILGLGDLERVK